MDRTPESDWKQFRKLHVIALERFCSRALDETNAISTKTGSSHARFLSLYDNVSDLNKDLARIFDDPRRSNCIFQLASMYLENLVTDEELELFSDETAERVRGLLS